MKTAIEIIDGRFPSHIKEVALEMKHAEESALKRAAWIYKTQVEEEFKSIGVDVLHQGTKYSDRLIDAVMMTKPKNGEIKFHILGIRNSKSGTFRARFFEGITKPRYQKFWNRNGKKVEFKKPRYTGVLNYHFFKEGIQRGDAEARKELNRILKIYIEKAFKK